PGCAAPAGCRSRVAIARARDQVVARNCFGRVTAPAASVVRRPATGVRRRLRGGTVPSATGADGRLQPSLEPALQGAALNLVLRVAAATLAAVALTPVVAHAQQQYSVDF